jgi:hypothetical protein
MTPEELGEIPGIDPNVIEKIFAAVNSYYSQFEEEAVVEQVSNPVPDAAGGGEAAAQAQTAPSGNLAAEGHAAEGQGAAAPAEPVDDPHAVATAGEGEFDTIKDSEDAG